MRFSIETFLDQCAALAKLERLIAILSIMIPAILYYADGSTSLRISISAYSNMENSYVFGSLLTIVAMMFIFNGFFYIRNFKTNLGNGKHSRWYNIVLGLSLLGVVFFHYELAPVMHYISAGIFFMGSAVIIAIFNNKKFRISSYIIALLSISAFIISYANKFLPFEIPFTSWMSILIAEWISLSVIATHYILESLSVESR